MDDLDRFTTGELEQMHAAAYKQISAALDALERKPAFSPFRRAGLAAVREQREHMQAIGRVLAARYEEALRG